MRLHEFQSKEILSRFGLVSPRGGVAITPEQARHIATGLAAAELAVKAQIHSGGRNAAGGVEMVRSPEEVEKAARNLLGRRLVTKQSGPAGWPVKRVLVEAGVRARRNLHLSLMVDASVGGIILLASARGGSDVERRVRSGEASLERLFLGTGDGFPATDVAAFANRIGLGGSLSVAFTVLVKGLLRALTELDASLIEINPLAITEEETLVALDAKVSIDDNALPRQPMLAALREEDELELNAQQRQLNYVRMDGDIGLAVNGAGLGLATLDLIHAANGRPANFMDIRTTATSLDIAHGFGLILDNPNARALLINVHGGGMQPCDTVADGLGIAMRRTGRSLPTVVRLAGNNAEFARSRFENFGCRVIDCPDMWTAATRAVAAAREGASVF
jgi:succinyl-CoA synthetase beta subunit